MLTKRSWDNPKSLAEDRCLLKTGALFKGKMFYVTYVYRQMHFSAYALAQRNWDTAINTKILKMIECDGVEGKCFKGL